MFRPAFSSTKTIADWKNCGLHLYICAHHQSSECLSTPSQCTASHIVVMSLRSKWAADKAVRAGLAVEGACLNRHVTDEQRSRRPIFNAPLGPAPGWRFFRFV